MYDPLTLWATQTWRQLFAWHCCIEFNIYGVKVHTMSALTELWHRMSVGSQESVCPSCWPMSTGWCPFPSAEAGAVGWAVAKAGASGSISTRITDQSQVRHNLTGKKKRSLRRDVYRILISCQVAIKSFQNYDHLVSDWKAKWGQFQWIYDISMHRRRKLA